MKYRVVCLSDGSAWIDSPENQHEITSRVLAGATSCVHVIAPYKWNSRANERSAISRAWAIHQTDCVQSATSLEDKPTTARKFGDGPPVKGSVRHSQKLRDALDQSLPTDVRIKDF